MIFTHTHIDVRHSGKKPHELLNRDVKEQWYVPFSPLTFDKPADWRFYKQQSQIMIPLHAYRTSDSPVDALGFAIQLGVNVVGQLGQRPIKRLHLSLGAPVMAVTQADGTSAWSFWCGFGVLFE